VRQSAAAAALRPAELMQDDTSDAGEALRASVAMSIEEVRHSRLCQDDHRHLLDLPRIPHAAGIRIAVAKLRKQRRGFTEVLQLSEELRKEVTKADTGPTLQN